MVLFDYKYVIIFAFAVPSLFMIALKASENAKYAAIDEFVVKREQSQFDDLPPAENVLLATGYRTGSSFLGELFNQNEDVFYVINNFMVSWNPILAVRAWPSVFNNQKQE